MLYRNRFAGHLAIDDPRTITSGAGGCTWPTIPPFRVQLSSSNATGEWLFLRRRPIILEQDILISSHDHVTWIAIEQPREVYYVLLEKIYVRNQHPNMRYFLTILLNAWPSERVWVLNATGKCNKDLHWGERYRTLAMGTTGDAFYQFQVEFDKLRYPGWHNS